jgi:prepilin-type N-terminal cleavage/methylation domain-containing protein
MPRQSLAAPSRRHGGFTIIEMVIVLAIAGIILVIIFKALPALQRNDHNSQRKHDVQMVLEEISKHQLNNSGTLPTDAQLEDRLNKYAKLVYYDVSDVSADAIRLVAVAAGSAEVTDHSPNTDVGLVYIYNRQKCSTNVQGKADNTGAGYNDVVALYAVETGDGSSPQCQQL